MIEHGASIPRILLTGGSGRLGSAIRKLIPCVAPSHSELDVTNADDCTRWVDHVESDVIIHCAAFVNAVEAERRQSECWRANVEATRNMVDAATGCRFVYVSTEYVFDGGKGNYGEADAPNPINLYGFTKFVGELIALRHRKSLILRAALRADPPWRFPLAFVDQWTSCRFVSEVAPDVVKAALMMDVTGILHIGGPRRSIYEMARSVTPGVGPASRHNAGVKLPRDTSLNSEKWRSLCAVSQPSSPLAATSI